MSIVLIDAGSDSLTISWPGTKLAERYVLEYRTELDPDFETLADNLMATQARKRNLDAERQYFFRVAAIFEDGFGAWMTHEEAFYPLTQEEEEFAMAPPKVRKAGPNQMVVVWRHVEDAYAYELQMRENLGGAEWETIVEEIETLEVKKKNLTSHRGYQFRVRPLNGEFDEAFSASSDLLVVAPGGGAVRQPKPEDFSMPAPWFKNAGKQAMLIRWSEFDGAEGYELQMRENTNKAKWTTIAAHLSGTEVKKKNLHSKSGYQFRVRPLGTYENRWSAASFGAIASG